MWGKSEQQAFLALVRAGLFPIREEGNPEIRIDGTTDWNVVYQLAQEQSVQGVVLQGIETVQGLWLKAHGSSLVPQMLLLQWIGNVQVIEQRNKAMNQFVADLVAKMREADIYAILVKGQGVAQCYEKPLWRPSGDVDLLLSEDNYAKAKEFMLPMSSSRKREEQYSKHWGMSIGEWYVEIHGSLRSGLSERVDVVIDAVQRDVFYRGNVRTWENGKTQVFLPGVDDDVFFVFTHFIKHFYKEKLGLRQVCDWIRLLWTYRSEIDVKLLERRLSRAGLMSEWRGFACLAVDFLGMPADAMPFYEVRRKKDEVRGKKLIKFILRGYSGNKIKDTLAIARIFTRNTMKFLPGILFHLNRLKIKERLNYC